MTDLRVYDRISDAVGFTPLVRLHRSVAGLPCEAFAKVEFMNPTGSAKDRIARHITRATSWSRTRRETPPWGSP
jgi:cystathionine beta-synthase